MDRNKEIAFQNFAVAEVFSNYSSKMRDKLLYLRHLIFETAAKEKTVGKLQETLKWSMPSYLTKPKIGTTIRIHNIDASTYAMYVHCQSNLIDIYKNLYPKDFTYEGKRAIVFNLSDKIPIRKLKDCILLALTYHLNKKKKKEIALCL